MVTIRRPHTPERMGGKTDKMKSLEPLDIGGQIMPNLPELEESVLGGCMTEPKVFQLVKDFLLVADFYRPENQCIYEAMLQVDKSGGLPDMLTVYEALTRAGKIDQVGGIGYITSINMKVSSLANIEYHAKLLQETAIRREIIADMAKGIKNAFEGEIYAPELISNLITDLDNRNRIIERPETMAEVYQSVIELEEIKGLKTGFKKLDQITNGLWGYVVLAAGPGEGKSIMALNIAINVCKRGLPVLVVSLEMKKLELVLRLMSDEHNLSVRDVMAKKYDMDKAMRSAIPDLNLNILDNGSMTIEDLSAIAKGMFKGKKGLIVIDYLQLLTTNKKTNTREQEIAVISRKIKQLQMELDIPILVLSQLNRDKNRKFYQLSDLRESGSIEQDANGVVFIYRPHKHHMDEYILGGTPTPTTENDAVISISKWRLGALGEFLMTFNGECSRFEDKETQFAPMPEFESQIIGIKQNTNEQIPF